LALYCNFLQHKVRRVFRSLAIGYAKSERMQVQTVQQWLALTEENGANVRCTESISR
jgi:hypothetical protein